MASDNAICLGFCAFVAILLIVILVPLSFSYVDYYDYGLAQRTTTGSVDTSRVYTKGRYSLGPTYKFLKYKADAHFLELKRLSVFSSGATEESIGTSFKLDITLTYLLRKDEVGDLHRESASTYRQVIESRAKEAIKNEAIFITFNEYFTERAKVEKRLRNAVVKRWNDNPNVHAKLDQFLLGRIAIPEEVAEKQLEAKIQNEKNSRENFLQQARIERELTSVEVNSILLEKEKILRTANAEAKLTTAKATAESQKIIADAEKAGALDLFTAAGITEQEHMIAFAYIRTLMERGNSTELDISYLSPDSVIRTKTA